MKWIPLSERKPDQNKNAGYYYFIVDGPYCKKIEACWHNATTQWHTHWLEFDFPTLPKEEKPKDEDFQTLKGHFEIYIKNCNGVFQGLVTEMMFRETISFLEKKFGEK